MKTRLMKWGAAALVIVGMLIGTASLAGAETLDRWGGPTGGTGQGSGYYQAAEPLDATEVDVLNRAIIEEYGALNTYNAAIDQLGNIYPFNQITRSEQQHVDALSRLFTKYNLDMPANPGLVTPLTFESVTDACQVGVDAEIADATLYDELFKVTDNADLTRVFENLQSASLNSHLPAFETCN